MAIFDRFKYRLKLTICNYLDMKKEFIKASELRVESKSTELLISIIRKLDGSVYLSGFGGAKYQEELAFEKAGIKPLYYDFKHPIYQQLWGEFIFNLSIIDLLFNCGKSSINIIKQREI